MAPSDIIDLRSDTVTKPTPAMRRVMAEAEVGDDVLGDDPTVIRLQERVAQVMGKEAAVFTPSGSMANQVAIRVHTQPADEVICHEDSHIIHYETGGPAALSHVMIRTARGERGLFDADQVEALYRPFSPHFPRSALVVVENTQNRGGGAVWPLEQMERVSAAAKRLGLASHLDGARIWNASAATGISPDRYARSFDTVSCCFSKGLGAPVGSALCGPKEVITRAHRFRKLFGGAMRQAGILAAAALHALESHRERLTQDHDNAKALGRAIGALRGLSVPLVVETNMVFVDVDPFLGTSAEFAARLRERGVLVLATTPRRLRAVCHLDVTGEMIERAAGVFRACAG